ncbi:MAG: hypothetical protein J6X55_14080 [Victivallales bacterium]|nr:hypothetical protein [Victivallales bacterium]
MILKRYQTNTLNAIKAYAELMDFCKTGWKSSIATLYQELVYTALGCMASINQRVFKT